MGYAGRMNMNEILRLMIDYNGKDVRRINHALKVYSFAQYIADREGCDADIAGIIGCAAILHDIGIHNAEKKFNSTAGNYQEAEGMIVASALLETVSIDADAKNRVLYLIGHHHSYHKIDGIDFRILVEADFLVNIFEDGMDGNAIPDVRERIFRTSAGKELLDSLY